MTNGTAGGVAVSVTLAPVTTPLAMSAARVPTDEFGIEPELIVTVVKGLPKDSGEPTVKPPRATVPTTSVVPDDVADGSPARTVAPVTKSPLVKPRLPPNVVDELSVRSPLVSATV